ncbi:tetratricopeptide repeat protein [Leucobacter allii]|uniref:tetratricopeptide repeat protein n=1 Tax=Leucobacter allii TaxID=2932247 RepID=UPI001FD11D4E|nr:tetratricopeptide repeat protein [Leucobacter allii]UOR00283.1 tetratricopeptide repeat protein [Leucobacter allii]
MTQQMPERIPGGGIDLSHLAGRGQTGAPAGAPGSGPGAPAGQSGQVVDVPSLVLEVTEAGFEQAAQLSTVVPVVVELWSAASPASQELAPLLEDAVRALAGRALLARVEAETNPGLAQAFQAQVVPTVVALVGGRPVPLIQGPASAEQLRELLAQLVQLAEQHGVTGRVSAPEADADAPSEPAEPVIPPAHLAAVEAAERGDYAAAVAEWEAVLQKAPADAEARAALVQMRLLQRLDGTTAEGIRSAAAEHPDGVDAQLAVADLDVSGGHVEDAFLRLLDLFAAASEDADRARIRERLLELFEVVGVADPRVIAARGRLANLLY